MSGFKIHWTKIQRTFWRNCAWDEDQPPASSNRFARWPTLGAFLPCKSWGHHGHFGHHGSWWQTSASRVKSNSPMVNGPSCGFIHVLSLGPKVSGSCWISSLKPWDFSLKNHRSIHRTMSDSQVCFGFLCSGLLIRWYLSMGLRMI